MIGHKWPARSVASRLVSQAGEAGREVQRQVSLLLSQALTCAAFWTSPGLMYVCVDCIRICIHGIFFRDCCTDMFGHCAVNLSRVFANTVRLFDPFFFWREQASRVSYYHCVVPFESPVALFPALYVYIDSRTHRKIRPSVFFRASELTRKRVTKDWPGRAGVNHSHWGASPTCSTSLCRAFPFYKAPRISVAAAVHVCVQVMDV